MDTKRSVMLPNRIVMMCADWASNHPPIKNQYTSHGIENKPPEVRAAAKMCEFAFALWTGVDFRTVKFGPDDGTDVIAKDIRFDIKSCVSYYSLLIYPFNKPYESKVFDRLALVKHAVPVFEIAGTITKDRFRKEHLTATEHNKPKLTLGTQYMHEKYLDDAIMFKGCALGLTTAPTFS
jgi:hypothetical protein